MEESEKSFIIASINIVIEAEKEEVRLAAVEAGQTTQNDAIAEMSEVIYSE